MMDNKPLFLILAGPNGAGKTTCAMTLLPHFLNIKRFVNADLIARGLSPFDPSSVDLKAGRIMVAEMRALRDRRQTFAIETTLASRSIANFIRESKLSGYATELIYVALDSPATAMLRVAQRVAQGGHDIPQATICRRFCRGLNNLFEIYMHLVDGWTILDNSGTKRMIIAKSMPLGKMKICDPDKYLSLQEFAQK